MQYYATTSILNQNFQEFYYEVLRQKERALRITEPDILNGENTQALEDMVAAMQKKLHYILERQSLQASRSASGMGASHFRDAQYVMVALADELFLSLNWPGAKYWQKRLMEAQIFETQVAGEQFFKRLEGLLAATDPTKADLANIYMMAISLGFKGRYSDFNDHEKLDWYRDQLFLILENRQNDLFYPGRPRLVSDVYDHTLSEPPGRGLPDLKVWMTSIASVVLVYIFVSYVVWYKLSSEMQEALNVIFEQSKQSPML